MEKFHDNCFSRVPRVTRDDPMRSHNIFSGPHRAPRSRLAVIFDGILWVASVAIFVAIVKAPALLDALGWL